MSATHFLFATDENGEVGDFRGEVRFPHLVQLRVGDMHVLITFPSLDAAPLQFSAQLDDETTCRMKNGNKVYRKVEAIKAVARDGEQILFMSGGFVDHGVEMIVKCNTGGEPRCYENPPAGYASPSYSIIRTAQRKHFLPTDDPMKHWVQVGNFADDAVAFQVQFSPLPGPPGGLEADGQFWTVSDVACSVPDGTSPFSDPVVLPPL